MGALCQIDGRGKRLTVKKPYTGESFAERLLGMRSARKVGDDVENER
jgi:hypothetical protein